MERSKIIALKDGTRFRVDKMTAFTTNWIIAQLLTKMLPSSIEDKLEMNLSSSRSSISEYEFNNIQNHCMKCCFRLEKQPNGVEAEMPVMTQEGTWAIGELEYDAISVLMLTVHALVFSAAPFFEGDVLKQVLETLPVSSLFSTSK